MGKGLIPVAPKTVYEAISNPRTRCIYDEMLKVGIDSNLNTYKIRLILVCQVKIIVLDKPVIKCDQTEHTTCAMFRFCIHGLCTKICTITVNPRTSM